MLPSPAVLPPLLAFFFHIVHSQQLVERPKINVVPKCGNQLISIDVTFDPDTVPGGRFTDWIVVGVTGRPECRLRGNGELHYVVEIAVFNDPCDTQMPSPGVFENRLRIGENPNVILAGDHNLLIKCVYGLPEVETMTLGPVNPSFHIAQNISASETLSGVQQLGQSLGNGGTAGAMLPPGLVSGFPAPGSQASIDGRPNGMPFSSQGPGGNLHSSIVSPDFGNPNLSTAGGNENQQLLENSVFNADFQAGQSSSSTVKSAESSQLSLLILLLLLVFVLLILCLLLAVFFCLRRRNTRSQNRRKLLVAVPPTSELGKMGLGHLWWSGKGATASTSTATGGETALSHEYIVNADRSPPKKTGESSATSPSGSSLTATSTVSGGATRGVSAASTALPQGDGINERGIDVDLPTAPKSYSEWRKTLLSSSTDVGRTASLKVIGKEVAAGAPVSMSQHNDDYITSFRSISEIYQSAETRVNHQHGSTSSIEGDLYAENSIPIERLIHCVDKIRGFGARRLTEQELGRWRALVARDEWFRAQICQADSNEAVLRLVDRPEYRTLFTQEKWSQIASCVMQARQKRTSKDTNLTLAASASALNVYIGDVGSNW